MSSKRRSGGRRGFRASAATAALIGIGVLALGGAAIGTTLVPSNNTASDTPSSTPSTTPPTASTPPTPSTPADEAAHSLATRSVPQRMAIPAIGVDTRLVQLHTELNKTMQLPPPRGAGWFNGSVTPGQPGTSIVTGFIRGSSQKDGVFVRLADLARGDRIRFTRKDGHIAVYKVTKIKAYAVGDFPTAEVYRSTPKPVLRLITTGGSLRPGAPAGNVVVDARIVSVR